MGTWYGNKLVSVGDDVWFYKFGTTITSGYASKSGTFGNCHGKVTSLYDASYAFPIVISGKVTAGTGGSFTSCTVKAADLNWGYQNYITYNGNGGTASTAHQTGYVGASLTATASRTGYTFAGWYNSSGTKYTTIPDSNGYTFYAHWTANKYAVTLNNDGATTAGTTSVTATYASAMPAITKPTKTGYTFGGYYYGTTPYYTAAGASARSYDYAGARTLTAKWTANTYTVHFDGNGATTGTMADQSFTYNTTQQLTGNGFSRGAAYAFTGWNTSPGGTGTAVAANYSASKLTATNGATVTLYAQWQLQYLSPSINNVLAQRFENGAADDVGTCVHVSFDWAVDLQVSSTNYATAVEIKYREQGTQAWTPLETITYSGQSASSISNTVNYTSPTGRADTDKNYDIFVGVTDYYGSHLDPPIPAPQATANTFLSVAFFTLDFSAGDPTATPPIQGGHGIGIGAPAPDTGLEIGMDTNFSGDVTGVDASFTGDISVDNIIASGDITDGSANTLGSVAATANAAASDASAAKSATDKYLGGYIRVVSYTTTFYIGAGTATSPTTKNITPTSSIFKTGEYLTGVVVSLNYYQLPYINANNKTFTWISALHDKYFTISNSATAWGSSSSPYTAYCTLFIHTA